MELAQRNEFASLLCDSITHNATIYKWAKNGGFRENTFFETC